MTFVLCLSIFSRLILLFTRFYIDNFKWYSELFHREKILENISSYHYFMTLDNEFAWVPPVYLGLHFFFINFISQGILLFNFGFALSNKKRIMNTDRKGSKNLVKRSRRETYLRIAAGRGGSDDEDEDDIDDDEVYYSGFRVSTGGEDQKTVIAPQNPFKIGTKLRRHLEADHSPNGGGGGLDTSFMGD